MELNTKLTFRYTNEIFQCQISIMDTVLFGDWKGQFVVWQVYTMIWQVDIMIWQVNIMIWQVDILTLICLDK